MRHHSKFQLFVAKSANPGSGTSWLLDAAGRKVTELRLGENDVSGIAPGVYFVREGPSGQPSDVRSRKVIIQ
jgi:hypothetical protein